MRSLPTPGIRVMAVLAPVCSTPVWPPVNVPRTGALLAPGQRTGTAALGVMGLSAAAQVHTAHRVVKRAVWSPLGASRRLLRRWVAVGVPAGVVVWGVAATSARRRGAHITAPGLDRAPGRASRAHGVHGSGRRGRGGRLLPPRRGAPRVGARPGMTARGPAAPGAEPQDPRAHTRGPRAWPISPVGGRGRPGRGVGLGAASREAAWAWLPQLRTGRGARRLTRQRLDAAREEPPPTRAAGPRGCPRLQGARRPPREARGGEAATPWTQLTMAQGEGDGPRAGAGATATAVGSHAGKPPGPLRWGRMRDPPRAWRHRPGGHPPGTRHRRRSRPGVSGAGPWKARGKTRGRLWAWRPSAQGRRAPGPGPRRRGCAGRHASRGSLISGSRRRAPPSAAGLGRPPVTPRVPRPWRWCGGIGGIMGVCHRHPRRRT